MTYIFFFIYKSFIKDEVDNTIPGQARAMKNNKK